MSEAKYDPLGRLAEAWAPGRTPGSGVPDFRAVYTIPAEETDPDDSKIKIRKPPYVTTYTRGYENRIETSVTLYDGLGRERQNQEEADNDSGWLITDTLYNNSGDVYQTNNAYLTDEAKPGELFTPVTDTAVPNITRYTYDGLGRVLQETPYMKYADPTAKESSSKAYPERGVRYEYGEDWSKVIQPAGDSSYRVYDRRDGPDLRTDTFNPAAPGGFTSTRYEYDGTARSRRPPPRRTRHTRGRGRTTTTARWRRRPTPTRAPPVRSTTPSAASSRRPTPVPSRSGTATTNCHGPSSSD